jgi:hypothetical protein
MYVVLNLDVHLLETLIFINLNFRTFHVTTEHLTWSEAKWALRQGQPIITNNYSRFHSSPLSRLHCWLGREQTSSITSFT